MNIDMEKLRENLREKYKNETKEETVARLTEWGVISKPIDWAVLGKVLTGLAEGKHHTADSDDIHYYPEKYSFNSNEFRDAFSWIEDYAEGRQLIVEKNSGPFPVMDCYFYYEGRLFHWNLMIGQGSATTLSYLEDGLIPDGFSSFVLTEKEEAVPGYHIRKINKGKFGQWSKVREEFEECEDALEQGIKVMVLVELSDLMGAIEAYVREQHNMSLKDLRKMAKVTSRAFKSGKRK